MYVNHFNDKNISVVGLGKLGACVAACFAYRGYNVTGLDINQDFVNLINLQYNECINGPALYTLLFV